MGQEQAREFGRWLRWRYHLVHGLLPERHEPGVVNARTTNYSRTVATLQVGRCTPCAIFGVVGAWEKLKSCTRDNMSSGYALLVRLGGVLPAGWVFTYELSADESRWSGGGGVLRACLPGSCRDAVKERKIGPMHDAFLQGVLSGLFPGTKEPIVVHTTEEIDEIL